MIVETYVRVIVQGPLVETETARFNPPVERGKALALLNGWNRTTLRAMDYDNKKPSGYARYFYYLDETAS